jgi:hypothetical protein
MPVSDDQIVKLIADANLVDKPTLDKLVADLKESHSSLSDLLIEKNLISDKNLGLLLADFLKMPSITLSEIAIAQEVLNIIPESVARKQKNHRFRPRWRKFKSCHGRPLQSRNN